MRTEASGARLLAIRAVNALGKPFGIDPVPRAFPNGSRELADRGAVFDRIYRTNSWGSRESRSGLGSESSIAAAYRRRLRDCLADINATHIFDAPCGDLNWMAPLARDRAIQYHGADISQLLLADLASAYPDLRLERLDICEDRFPQAHVWHCRDCLFHLPFKDIRRALENFAKSAIPYCLITTHRALVHRNLDVAAGGFRYLDLERKPISLPKAERYLKDFRLGRDFPRYVGLWRRETIAECVERWADVLAS